MFILPVDALLNANPYPKVSYRVALLCLIVFLFQISTGITESLIYHPDSWNPVRMVLSSLAHGSFEHIFFNMLAYLVFAPAVEMHIGNSLRYIWIMLFIALVVGFCDSVFALLNPAFSYPSLGFSGVVMGIIGLSAYLTPRLQIRIIVFYWCFWKCLYLPAWVVAFFYLSREAWTLYSSSDFDGINVLAHVSGGLAGYIYGVLWLGDRRGSQTEQRTENKYPSNISAGNFPEFRKRHDSLNQVSPQHQATPEASQLDEFCENIYHLSVTGKDSLAKNLLLSKANLQTSTCKLEAIFKKLEVWGATESLLCLGRLIIYKLDCDQSHDRALTYIGKCQQYSTDFLLPDLSRVTHYIELAEKRGRLNITKNLIDNCRRRFTGRAREKVDAIDLVIADRNLIRESYVA